MTRGVETKGDGVFIAPKWRIIVDQAVPEADILEVKLDSAKSRFAGGIESQLPSAPSSFSARLRQRCEAI